MLSFLKNHPFGVEAFFESSLVLTFAVPKSQLERLIPECLSLDLLHDEWAFVAVAMVQTRHLRPKGFPQFMGNNFLLTGYRIFVRYTSSEGKRLRGLYILKSETDKRKMELLGNIFTQYNYTTTDITCTTTGPAIKVASPATGFEVLAETGAIDTALPSGSPFTDWKEARKFAGPLPFTFSYNPLKKEVLIIEGVRENWVPQPVKVIGYNIPFISGLGLKDAVLANAFIINNIPYYWKKGRIEQWGR
jgi:uncharacterized protein YqjF (DUF2071 family)